jgi:ElaB/YqjD/DUF883 family membrane-anchored ribosome-binding protein
VAGNGNSSRTPDEIRSEIEATRQQMGKTIDALEVRLDPNRLKQEASSTIRDQTVGRVERFAGNATDNVKGVGNDVLKTIKDNPLPAALAAIGLGWLIVESRNENQGSNWSSRNDRWPQRYEPYDYRYARHEDVIAGQADYSTESTREAPADWQDRAQQLKGQAQEATDRFRQAGSDMQDKAQDVMDQAQDRFRDFTDTAQDQMGRAGSRLEDLMDENPLLVGAAAVALGAAIGMSLPATSKEDEILGPQRDELMDRAQDKINDTVHKVGAVAKQAGNAATQTVKNEAQK